MLPPPNICRQLVTNPGAGAVSALLQKDYICIPQDAATFQVDGACFTGPTQISWVRQLVGRPGQFVLHMDGKYKLHHGVWILLTIGTHCLRAMGETATTSLGNTFIPLVYLFCKNHESTGTCTIRYIHNTHAIHILYTHSTWTIHIQYTPNTCTIHITIHTIHVYCYVYCRCIV